jgi:hypothetical protein
MKSLMTGLALLALATTPTPADSTAPKGEADQPAKIDLRLKPSTHHGYAPLSIQLDGELVGVEDSDLNSCLISEEWTGETMTSGPPPNTKHTIPCVTRLEDGRVPRRFQRDVTIEEPGSYIYRILVTPSGQRTIASRSIDIKVARSRFRVKGTKNGY